MKCNQDAIPNFDLILVLQPAVRHEWRALVKAQVFTHPTHALYQRFIALIRTFNRHRQKLSQVCSSTGMIWVWMSNQKTFNLNLLFINCLEQEIDVPTRIDNDRLAGFKAPQKRAILPGPRYWNDSAL